MNRACAFRCSPRPIVLAAALLAVCAANSPDSLAGESFPEVAAANPRGAEIYRTLCAECHGDRGEGVVEVYPHALVGDKSVVELAALIDKTMPDGEPEKCTGDDARVVASYVYEAFYSPIAQARIAPPRIELSRLTVRQYRHTLADLIGSFRWTGQWGDKRGLEAQYFDSRRFDRGKRAFERVDSLVKFDFGEASPEKDKIKPEEFYIHWEGSLRAPDTGEYEIVVRTENGARLWLNDNSGKPLVDAGVRSGDDKDFSASIFLLGGRAYPLRLEFFKSAKSNEKRASIELLWKPPQRILETVPTHCLSPESSPSLFVAATPFPPDDRSIGYERGSSISKAWDQAATAGALETADFVVARLNELAGTKDGAPDREQKIRAFCRKFTERAFRRPLSESHARIYVERQFEEAADTETAVRRVVLLTLKSPRFLYREVDGPPDDPFNVASRLAYALTDSLPDAALIDAAAKGQLKTREQVRGHAVRLAADSRARAKLREFLMQWLKVDQVGEMSKDSKLFPDFDDALAADLRTSLDLFIDEILASPTPDYRRFFLDDATYMNGRMAKFYGAELPDDAPFQPVKFQAPARSGVLSHPYLLASMAYTSTSSPIHRGVFISRNLLGRSLRPPPEAVAPLAPDLHASLTTRERVALQTKAKQCAMCHSMINALGFTLENFDAVGRYRDKEKSKPINASGGYTARDGKTTNFGGLEPLAKFLAESDESHAAFVEQLFHYSVKQPVRAYGPETLPRLVQAFSEKNFDIRSLLVEIATTAALTADAPPP